MMGEAGDSPREGLGASFRGCLLSRWATSQHILHEAHEEAHAHPSSPFLTFLGLSDTEGSGAAAFRARARAEVANPCSVHDWVSYVPVCT